jgi:hypothetical protein
MAATPQSGALAMKYVSSGGTLLLYQYVGALVLGLALDAFGFMSELALLPLLLCNLVVAYRLGKAAQALGRNRWLYTLAAGLPPAAIAVCIFLYSAAWARSMDGTP